MQPECTPRQLEFEALGKRQVVGKFNGGRMKFDAGALLLREADRLFDVTGRLAACFVNYRNPLSVENHLEPLVARRVIADVIRQISNKADDNLNELWRWIVFTILVSNKADHLKNDGFIYFGGGQWRLSPAFDINPAPGRHRVLETRIIGGGSFDASIEIALEACEFFDLQPEEARAYTSNAAKTIRDSWKEALKNEGVSAQEMKQYADAFEHRDSGKALQWHE